MSHYSYSRVPTWAMPAVVVGLVAVAGLVIWGLISFNTHHMATITVCSKERAATSKGAEYRIYAADGIYVMKDSLIGTVRYNTADAYARIKDKTTYDIVWKGWRIPFFSAFPNILEANVVPADRQAPHLCD